MWNPILMKKLLKSEIYGSVHCSRDHKTDKKKGKVNNCRLLSPNAKAGSKPSLKLFIHYHTKTRVISFNSLTTFSSYLSLSYDYWKILDRNDKILSFCSVLYCFLFHVFSTPLKGWDGIETSWFDHTLSAGITKIHMILDIWLLFSHDTIWWLFFWDILF